MSVIALTRPRVHALLGEIAKFGAVGGLAFLVDVGLFNVLTHTSMGAKPLTAKTVSVIIATLVAYLGNRHWTYRDRGSYGVQRETVAFFIFNAIALVIALSCLGFSHYVLGFTSPLADNISANFIGMGLGTAFRFISYRKWVFPETAPAAVTPEIIPGTLIPSTVILPTPALAGVTAVPTLVGAHSHRAHVSSALLLHEQEAAA